MQMKVAIVGNKGVGKTVFSILLSTVLASTQKYTTSIVNINNQQDYLNFLSVDVPKSFEASVGVYKALLECGDIKGKQLFDYSIRIGRDRCYMINTFVDTYTLKEGMNLYSTTIKELQAELVITECPVNANKELKELILNNSNLILYVINQDISTLREVNKYYNFLSDTEKLKVNFICQKYDKDISSDKQIAKLCGIPQRVLFTIPYTSAIGKLSFNAKLDLAVDYICDGKADFIEYRNKLYQIMSLIYDTNTKRIKGVEEWCK